MAQMAKMAIFGPLRDPEVSRNRDPEIPEIPHFAVQWVRLDPRIHDPIWPKPPQKGPKLGCFDPYSDPQISYFDPIWRVPKTISTGDTVDWAIWTPRNTPFRGYLDPSRPQIDPISGVWTLI